MVSSAKAYRNPRCGSAPAPAARGGDSGVYTNDTFDITHRLSVTGGGRYNIAQIAMTGLLGTSPDLSAQHTFERFNPVVGLTKVDRLFLLLSFWLWLWLWLSGRPRPAPPAWFVDM
jgi:outer membrane receptor protein involved in Fe transport